MSFFPEKNFKRIESARELVKRIRLDYNDRTLFRYYNDSKEIVEMTYKEFSDKVDNLCAGLYDKNLCGKRIAIVGESCPEWVISYLATLSTGSVAIPLDKELATEQLFEFLKISEASAIVFTKSFCKKFKEYIISNNTNHLFIPIDCDDEEILRSKKVIPFSVLLKEGATRVAAGYETDYYEMNDELREMLFTSGTTGTSKCVTLSEKNVISCINSCCASVDFSHEDTIVSVLPLHHTYELAVMIAAINLGAVVCINDSLKYVLRNFKAFKPTGLVLVPLFVSTMYKKIIDEAKKTGQYKKLKLGLKLSSALLKVGIDIRKKLFADVLDAFGGKLEKIVSGGAALSPTLISYFKNLGINIYEGYGITECSPLISVNPYTATKLSSVGPCVETCHAIIDGKDKNSKGFVEGEILVKGENVMLGYYKNDKANAEVFTDDGYFRTGDIGYMDEDGYIYITGRKKSVIVLENGKNVFPEEIEEYLSHIETIAECIVVGRTEKDSVILTAICYPAFDKFPKNTSLEEIGESIKKSINAMNKNLPSFKQVRNIELRKSEFEKTTSRKIKRYLVK